MEATTDMNWLYAAEFIVMFAFAIGLGIWQLYGLKKMALLKQNKRLKGESVDAGHKA
jgi:cytochrome oxidase assembly protein ShyY1